MKLNPMQARMGEIHEGAVICTAVPGSGKTTALIHNLNQKYTRGINPGNVLVTAFNREAAKNIKERLSIIWGPEIMDAPIGTCHSICNKILNAHTDGKRKLFIGENAVRQFFRKQMGYKCSDELLLGCVQISGLLKNHLAHPDPSLAGGFCHEQYEMYRDIFCTQFNVPSRLFHNLWLAYEKRNKDHNLMDMDDILLQTFILLRDHPDILKSYQHYFEHVLVDEYQDTNAAQYEIYKMLAAPQQNIIVVGDEDQGIYSFRGSSTQYIQRFKDDWPDALHLSLELNYRSQANVCLLANEIVKENERTYISTIEPTREGTGKPLLIFCQDERNEADMIAELVKHGSTPLQEVAVITRTNGQQCYIEEAFINHNIPYLVMDSDPFFMRREVQVVLKYLTITKDLATTASCDMALVKDVANAPWRFLGKEIIDEWKGPKDLVLSEGGSRLLGHLNHLHQICKGTKGSAGALVEALVNQPVGLLSHFCKDGTVSEQSIVKSVLRFMITISQGKHIDDFMRDIQSIQTNYRKMRRDHYKVTISTIHKAKGREWADVYIPGFNDGTIPQEYATDMDEERRLLYVASTRAKNNLFYTCLASEIISPFAESIRDHLEYSSTVPYSQIHSTTREILSLQEKDIL